MKTIILTLLITAFIFAVTPNQEKAKVCSEEDISVVHTNRIEKRIHKIEKELEVKAERRVEKAKKRAEKSKVREEKIKLRDKNLKAKAKLREDNYCPENHSTIKEIKAELTNETSSINKPSS